MQLPENYWDDVNRDYDKIRAGLPVSYEAVALYNDERYQYDWPAQEDGVEACILGRTYHLLGVVTVRHHYLGLSRTECDTEVTHWIRFDPGRKQIVRVRDDTYPIGRERTFTERRNALWGRSRIAKQVGRVLLPTAQDYWLLHSELKSGAGFRRNDLNESE